MAIRDILAPYGQWAKPRSVEGNPFRLACRLGEPASPEEIAQAWSETGPPSGAQEFWLAHREVELFIDVDYGQWGLRLLSPSASVARTTNERNARRDDFRDSDIIIGEFLGDADLVVLDEVEEVLVALPLDPRADWPRVGGSLTEFLSEYLDASGEKYWEAQGV